MIIFGIQWQSSEIFKNMDQDLIGVVFWIVLQRYWSSIALTNRNVSIYQRWELHIVNFIACHRTGSQFDIVTPSGTFDQPLWVKTVEIIQAKDLKIVPKLGGFRSLMSFVGSLCVDGYGGFWCEEILRDYAPNSVLRILSGKAIRRALRGDFLADAAYNIKLLFPIFPSCKNFKEPTTENIEDETLLVKNWFFFRQFTLINWGEGAWRSLCWYISRRWSWKI